MTSIVREMAWTFCMQEVYSTACSRSVLVLVLVLNNRDQATSDRIVEVGVILTIEKTNARTCFCFTITCV